MKEALTFAYARVTTSTFEDFKFMLFVTHRHKEKEKNIRASLMRDTSHVHPPLIEFHLLLGGRHRHENT